MGDTESYIVFFFFYKLESELTEWLYSFVWFGIMLCHNLAFFSQDTLTFRLIYSKRYIKSAAIFWQASSDKKQHINTALADYHVLKAQISALIIHFHDFVYHTHLARLILYHTLRD